MKDTHLKAMDYVLQGRVEVETVTYTDDGEIAVAVAFVKGDTGTWLVHIDADTVTCNCPYGMMRHDAEGHAHDKAVRLAVSLRERMDNR